MMQTRLNSTPETLNPRRTQNHVWTWHIDFHRGGVHWTSAPRVFIWYHFFCSLSEKAVVDDYSCTGLYSAIFCMYIQHHVPKELGIQVDKKSVLLYLLCILYILSTAAVILHIVQFVIYDVSKLNHNNNFPAYTTYSGSQHRFFYLRVEHPAFPV